LESNPENNQDETSLSDNYTSFLNDNYNDHRLRVDVYHHFDENVEELITTFIKLLKSPIEIQITNNGSSTPTKITLVPGDPETNV